VSISVICVEAREAAFHSLALAGEPPDRLADLLSRRVECVAQQRGGAADAPDLIDHRILNLDCRNESVSHACPPRLVTVVQV
jgi:hypothetical protein